MSYIINIWDVYDFCATHGRIIPHYEDSEGHFTKFHCADKRHDDSDIVVCSISAQIQEIYFSIKISSHFVFGRESNAQ